MTKIQNALAKIRATKLDTKITQREKLESRSDQEKAIAKGAHPKQIRNEDPTYDSDSAVSTQVVTGRDRIAENSLAGEGGGGRKLDVNRDRLGEAGLIAPEADEQAIGQQFQDIKRFLIDLAFGKRATKIEDGNIIMITSSLVGEGKTFSSINLALSMAKEKDHSVLLIDADVVQPKTSDVFGASGEPGLLDLLEDSRLRIDSVISPTDVPGLSIMPAGQLRQNATELLASSRMEDVLSALSLFRPNGIVILDSPPLLQTSEAKVLATLAGQIVLVVRAERTARSAVLAAISMLNDDKPVNLLLNQARLSSTSAFYPYGVGQSFEKREKAYSVAGEGKDMWGH